MKFYCTADGSIVERGGRLRRVQLGTDSLFEAADVGSLLNENFESGQDVATLPKLLAPVGRQEVWAAGVTYLRSKTARMDESRDAGGGDFYDRVYDAPRPELFFKSTRDRVSSPGEPIRVRADSKWNVPEPELTLAVNAAGQIFGYTVGNDVSSRDIEGENPLYLPQAKVYTGSCALGPALLIPDQPLASDTPIRLRVLRADSVAFEGETTLSQMRRRPEELVEYLFRDQVLQHGVLLMTGTGVVPPDSFTLRSGDRVEIEIPPIGTLVNPVA